MGVGAHNPYSNGFNEILFWSKTWYQNWHERGFNQPGLHDRIIFKNNINAVLMI